MATRDQFSELARAWIRIGDGVMSWRRVFPGRADQVTQGRRFVAALLADTARAEDAEWVTAELISNALLHTRSSRYGGWFGLEVSRQSSDARLAVSDLGGGDVPQFRVVEPEVLAENGRGLLGVRALAAEVGIEGSPCEGHVVWARLALNPLPLQQAS